tara:strand:- start:197 stop:832 length:636 start_codon:yes stop_codon:yes gene_type:complete
MSDYDIFELFNNFINEDINATASEEDKQSDLGDELKKYKAPKKKKEKINQDKNKKTEDEDLSSEEKIEDDDEQEDESPSTIHLEDAAKFKKLRSALNQFRASRSLSDPEIMEELKEYFERLSASEKKILFIFVKGLTQVTLSDAKGRAANIPSDFGFSVEKKGASSSEKIKSKKRQIKAKKKSVDNMSPIVVGEGKQQNKDYIYKILQENR